MSSAFLLGVRDSLAVQLAVCPFAVVSGAVAAETGLTLPETMLWSILIMAGAAQLAALGLLAEDAPILIAVLTGLAINLRFAMYSASIAPHLLGVSLGGRLAAGMVLVDQSYALSIRRYAEHDDPQDARLFYFLGVGVMTCMVWHLSTVVGHVLGAGIPPGLSLDFMIPLCFSAVVAPLLRGRPVWAAALVAVAVSVALRDVPYSMGVLIGAFCGIAAGYVTESRMIGGEA